MSDYMKLWNSGNESDKDMVRKQTWDYLTTATSMLLRSIYSEGKYSYLSMVKKYLIRLWKQCNQSLRMNHPSILLISRKNYKLQIEDGERWFLEL